MVASAPIRQATKVSAEEAAGLVESGMWVDYGFGMGQPDAFDRALAARKDDLWAVKIRSCLTMRPRAVIDVDPTGEHFNWFNWHFSGYDRKQHDAGRCSYIPMNFGEAPDYYRRFIDPVDVVVLKTCPIDDQGNFNFGGAATYQRAMVERAQRVVVETSAGHALCLRAAERRPCQRGRLRDRRRRRAGPGDRQPAAERGRPQGRRPHCRRDRGRRLPADRHRRHAQRGLRRAQGQRRARPRHPHRDDDRRDHRPLPGGHRHRRPQADQPRRDGVHLRRRVAPAIRRHRPQPAGTVLPGRLHQPAAQRHAERSRRLDQQQHADRPAGPGGFRERRSPASHRHRRAAPVRSRRLCLARAASRSSASPRPTTSAASREAGSCST